jgi:zinc-ribbon domain
MKLATGQSYCPNCGTSLPQQAAFCGNCGTRISAPHPQLQQMPPVYYPTTPSQAPVSTGAYKALIAVLLVIIVLLGVGLYATSSGHPFSLGAYRYSLANPPNAQSVQPPNWPTAQPPYQGIWNSCGGPSGSGCNMTSNGWREGSVPDTYDYFVSFTSTVPIGVYFFTLGQFVQYTVCNGDINCVSGYHTSIPASTSQSNTVFKLAEGCGDYVAIYVASSSGVMYPNISVKQNATPFITGYCAQAGGG